MFKIVILGDVKTGKKTIFKNINSPYIYIDNTRAMLGTDFYELYYEHHNISVKVSLWSIDGHNRFRNLYPQFIRASKAVVLVYDVTNRQSFNNL
jgi:Ras-related protein Rab-6A